MGLVSFVFLNPKDLKGARLFSREYRRPVFL